MKTIKEFEVKTQLDRILSSSRFSASERLRRFLSYVVQEYYSGNAKNIKAYNIALEVFDKSPDFDPQLDPIVRIYAGRLRSALVEYYTVSELDAPIIIEIPKGTYCPTFKRRSEKPNQEDRTLHKLKRSRVVAWSAFVIVILVALMSVIIQREADPTESDEYGRTTIRLDEILIPENYANGNSFRLQLIEDLEIALTQFSVILYKEEADDNRNYRYILSGSIRHGEQFQEVYIRLVENGTGIQVFDKKYQQKLDINTAANMEEIFANLIAIDIADEFGDLQNYRHQIAQSKGEALLPHEGVLAYYDYLTQMNKQDNDRLIRELEDLITTHNNYAPLWAALSGLYMDKYKHFGGDQSDFQRADEAIRAAERINPRSWHVQNHIAQLALLEGDTAKFYTAIDRQLELNSNTTMVGQIGLWLCLIEDLERGIPLIEEAKEKNPYYPRFYHFGNALYFLEQDDLDKAYAEARKVQMPNLYWDPLFRAAILGMMEADQEAEEALNELLALRPDFAENGSKSMSLALYSDKYRNMLLDGLRKAGLEIE